DEDPQSVTCTVAFRLDENAAWQPIAPRRLEHRGNRFELTWEPTRYKVADGVEIQYRLTLRDGIGLIDGTEIIHEQEINGWFPYRSWWNRQPGWIKAIGMVATIICIYILACGVLLLIYPVGLVRICSVFLHRALLERLKTFKSAQTFIKSVIRFTSFC